MFTADQLRQQQRGSPRLPIAANPLYHLQHPTSACARRTPLTPPDTHLPSIHSYARLFIWPRRTCLPRAREPELAHLRAPAYLGPPRARSPIPL